MKYFTQVAIGYFSGFFPLQNKFESYFKLEKTWASNKLQICYNNKNYFTVEIHL